MTAVAAAANEYEKILTATDVEQKLTVPVKWLSILPAFEEGSHELHFGVVDGVGFYWSFCCSIRREGRYPKPVFQAEGWLKFVHNKKLQARDKIVLDSEVNHFRQTQFRIRAQKFNDEGQYWYDV